MVFLALGLQLLLDVFWVGGLVGLRLFFGSVSGVLP